MIVVAHVLSVHCNCCSSYSFSPINGLNVYEEQQLKRINKSICETQKIF